ncbi:MAG TPA: hypothetical protein VN255_05955 [Mycobacterium sp.]|nr:hypothetical protein [Mycobacterium sp.]HWT48126.1 hypothetical protein [Mycobacterium sp.]
MHAHEVDLSAGRRRATTKDDQPLADVVVPPCTADVNFCTTEAGSSHLAAP